MRAEEVDQCGKCGLCLALCPVYQVTREETVSPRAKVQLIKHFARQDIQASPYLRDLVSKCLMCGACSSFCPSGVEHSGLFMRMRSQMTETFGQNWRLRVLHHLLSGSGQLELASRFARWGQKITRNMSRSSIGDIPLKRLPSLNSRPFRRQAPAVNEPEGQDRGTVLYFTGCATSYLYDQTGWATLKVLTRLGYRVKIPQSQQCCGMPLFAHGHEKQALGNIQSAVNLFGGQDIQAVVVDCATCGSALRTEYLRVLANLGQPVDRAQELAEKVYDVTEFAAKHTQELSAQVKIGAEARPVKVTYHSPCHLKNFQKVSAQIDTFLRDLPGVRYVQAADWESCCGGGGTFFYEFPEITREMVASKIDNAQNTAADIWLTGCPGCRMNLAGNLDQDSNLQLQHPIQVVAGLLGD
ncbi:MAG: (Fe-S)-binding protein [Desulfovermiculus sp.]|nr:(Fe-S)-binding protein [Desulfovermiculus sp.]